MQKIERYGVIALVFLLVTILAVSLWGESKGSWFSWGAKDKKDVAALPAGPRKVQAPALQPIANPANANGLPLSTAPLAVPLGGSAQQPAVAAPLGGTQVGGSQPGGAPLALAPNAGAQLQPPLGSLAQTGRGIASVNANTPIAQPIDSAHPVLRGQATHAQPVAPAAPAATGRTYVVKSGDTLGEIAAQQLGSSKRWEELSRLNGNLDPAKLVVGTKLQLPAGGTSSSVAAAPRSASEPKPKAGTGSYVIRSGDSLSRIAARELGDADLWNQIVALNPGLDPQRLKVGAKLILPATRLARSSESKAERIAYGPRVVGTKSRVQ